MTDTKTQSELTQRPSLSTDEGYEISYFAWRRGVADQQSDQPLMKWPAPTRN